MIATADIALPQAEAIARKFVGLGAHVIFFPRGTKRCTTTGWENLATNDLNAALAWAVKDPYANAGLVGKQDGLWGLDNDADLIGEYETKFGRINTYRTRTVSGGEHLLFRQDDASWAMGNVSIKDENGAELLSARIDNRYVVLAGSWAYPNNDESQPLTQYTAVDSKASVIEAPESLLQFIKDKKAEWDAKGRVGKSAASTSSEAHSEVHEGGRNDYLASRAGKLRNAGASYETILAELQRFNERDCKPWLDDVEVEAIAKSYSRYPEGQVGRTLKMGGAAETAPPTLTEEEMVEKLNQEFPAWDGQAELSVPMLVEGFMPEGVSFFGAYAGTIKTFVALSVVKALTTGEPLWGVFPVKEKVAVLYLTPEVSKAAFKPRLLKMGIVQDKGLFRYRTLSEGVTRLFDDPLVVEMVRRMGKDKKVLVVADTAIRFMQMKKGRDENNSMENSLQEDSQVLRALEKETGNSISFLFIHHSTKALNAAGEMTLENVLRGTGDFSAMADTVYGFRTDHKLRDGGAGPTEVDVVNLKPKDFEPPAPFRLGLYRTPREGEGNRPISLIDTTGDMLYIDNQSSKEGKEKRFVDLIVGQPNISMRDVAEALRMRPEEVKPLGKKLGWKQEMKGVWNPDGTPALSARGKQKTASIWVRILPLPNSPGMVGKVTEFLRITLPKKPEGWMFSELEPLCNQFDLSLGEPSLYPNVVIVDGIGKGGLWTWVEMTEGEQQEGEAAR